MTRRRTSVRMKYRMYPEAIEAIRSTIQSLDHARLDAKELSFVTEMARKIDTYGDEFMMSPASRRWLSDIKRKYK